MVNLNFRSPLLDASVAAAAAAAGADLVLSLSLSYMLALHPSWDAMGPSDCCVAVNAMRISAHLVSCPCLPVAFISCSMSSWCGDEGGRGGAAVAGAGAGGERLYEVQVRGPVPKGSERHLQADRGARRGREGQSLEELVAPQHKTAMVGGLAECVKTPKPMRGDRMGGRVCKTRRLSARVVSSSFRMVASHTSDHSLSSHPKSCWNSLGTPIFPPVVEGSRFFSPQDNHASSKGFNKHRSEPVGGLPPRICSTGTYFSVPYHMIILLSFCLGFLPQPSPCFLVSLVSRACFLAFPAIKAFFASVSPLSMMHGARCTMHDLPFLEIDAIASHLYRISTPWQGTAGSTFPQRVVCVSVCV